MTNSVSLLSYIVLVMLCIQSKVGHCQTLSIRRWSEGEEWGFEIVCTIPSSSVVNFLNFFQIWVFSVFSVLSVTNRERKRTTSVVWRYSNPSGNVKTIVFHLSFPFSSFFCVCTLFLSLFGTPQQHTLGQHRNCTRGQNRYIYLHASMSICK